MFTSTQRAFRYAALATAAAAALILSGCGSGSPNAASSGTSSSVVTIVSGPTGPFVPGLSPFSSSDSPAFMGVTSLVYEPLIMFNAIAPTQPPKPWLASSYAWSNGGKTLTFTIPSGRTWSDGKPLTAADVAFTFNLIKKDPATNVQGISFTSASAPSPTTAVINFSGPAYTQLFSIAKVFIVPKHIWASISNPQKFANPKPVGSGPYLLASSTPQEMTFTKNPHYWQAGLPKVQTVRVIDYTAQNAAINALSSGQIDWANLYLANPKQQFTGSDPTHNKLWLAPAGDWFLCPNTAVKPFDNVKVRQALAYSIDRQKAIPQVEGQFYAPTTSPTGLRAGQMQFMPPALASASLSYNPAKVRSLLASAGFTASHPLKVSLMLPSPYTDWMSLGTLFVNEMKAAGIDASLDGVSANTWTSDVADGSYQVTFCGVWSTSGPYFTYNTLLNSSLTAPIGKAAISNVVRWNDSKTNSLLNSFQTTASTSTQTTDVQGVATIVANQMPIIPLMSVSSFGEYSMKNFSGFPGPGNAYQTDTIGNPYTEDVVIHLVPVK